MKLVGAWLLYSRQKYVPHTPVKMSCATTQFPKLLFFGPHAKSHGVVLDGISDNMTALVQLGKYSAINA